MNYEQASKELQRLSDSFYHERKRRRHLTYTETVNELQNAFMVAANRVISFGTGLKSVLKS